MIICLTFRGDNPLRDATAVAGTLRNKRFACQISAGKVRLRLLEFNRYLFNAENSVILLE
jgi:hypothetical protein